MRKTAGLLVLLTGTLIGTACERAEDVPELANDTTAVNQNPTDATGMAFDSVVVELINANGAAAGSATLTEQDGGVAIALTVTGAAPGEHGFHIHGTGACEPPSFESAGDHFAPEGRQHGSENPEGPHAGDLPNVTVGDDGSAQTTFVAENVSLRPSAPGSLLDTDGSALVLHESADDYRTDPSGNSGSRIACGVVE